MTTTKYNLAIIGGGPAGMIAAGHAAELGTDVILLEKNKSLGKKLLITGKGRCNITNAENNKHTFLKTYGKNGKFLYSAFSKFSNQDTIAFFEKKGLATKTERGNRVFPISDKALTVLSTLEQYLIENNVTIRLNTAIKRIIIDQKGKIIQKLILDNGDEIIADKYLIATGGKSYPKTGSSGDAYKWLTQMGHSIVTPVPSLTPIIVKESIVKKLEGLSLKNVEISLWSTKKICSFFGEAIFTHNGLSGPTILNLSREIIKNTKSDLKIKIDYKPALDYQKLDKRILKDFQQQNNRIFKNSLNQLLPKSLIPIIIQLSEIDENKQVNQITKTERKKLIKQLKEFELSIKDVVGLEKAIITSGGVNLKEVDSKTMKSKIINNLYFSGEILDIDGPTGGYNLQVAWSTGYLAANCNDKNSEFV